MARSRLIRPPRKGLPVLLILSILMVVAAFALFVYELLQFTQQEDRLPIGVIAGGVSVGNMTDLEAQTAIEDAYSSPVTLYYDPDSPINLIPDEIGFTVNTDVMIANARAAGESGTGFWGRFFNYMIGVESTGQEEIPLVADYQTNALRTRLTEIGAGLGFGDGDGLGQKGAFGQAQHVAEEPGDEQRAEQVGQGHQAPVAGHCGSGYAPGEHRGGQAHHVAGQQFAASEDGQDQADGEHRCAQQVAQRCPRAGDHGADVDVQQKAQGDEGTGQKAQHQN